MSTLDPSPVGARADDAALVARVLRRERGAFEALMRAHNQRLFRVTRALLGDDAEAEDAMQQAYLAAYLHLSGFEGQSSLATWLTRIARNEAISRLRKRTQRAELALEGEDEAMDTTRQRARTPEDAAALAQLSVLVERAVDALPEIYREVFVLRAVEGLDTKETADALEITEDLAKVRLHRARKQLERALLDDLDAQTPHAFVFLGDRCDRVVHGVLAQMAPEG